MPLQNHQLCFNRLQNQEIDNIRIGLDKTILLFALNYKHP